MRMDPGAVYLIKRLNGAGYEAYAVGGCVRDLARGVEPHDWDLCTSATPEQMRLCLDGLRLLDTGVRHGTLSALLDGRVYEITTFRAETGYSDHRHPDQVRFVTNLYQDLSRRDFTINAMAADARGAIADPFGGRADLDARRVRCVGEARLRFEEDALRILRALRFASRLDFEIEPDTERAMREKAALLEFVSAERIYAELTKTITGTGAGRVLARYGDVLGAVIPEILPAIGFDQKSPHHDADVWTHTARAVDAVEARECLRWAMLLHDLGKPGCFSLDARGVGHFYGHAQAGAEIAERTLHRLRAPRAVREGACELIRSHASPPLACEKQARRALARYGGQVVADMMAAARADALAQNPAMRAQKLEELARAQALIEQVARADADLARGKLNISGRDLIGLGMREGVEVGRMLGALRERVLEGELENSREALLRLAQKMLDKPD